MGERRKGRVGEGRKHPSRAQGGKSVDEWWSRWERDDPPATHLVTFRPVVQVRVTLAPGADADRVIAEAVAAWAGELSSDEGPDGQGWAEFWGASLGDAGLVVGVENIDAGYAVEADP